MENTSLPSQALILPENFDFSEDFKYAFDLMHSDARCIFITGRAGCGKSTLLTYFVQKTLKKVALLASTGLAALRIRGQTIHSFFGFPPRLITNDDIRTMYRRDLYVSLDAIVIDEISMVRADLMDGIDWFLRKNRAEKNKPFGGVQMIFFGDMYQLPPVVSNREEGQYLSLSYASPYFFDAHVFSQVHMETVELTKVYRQKDRNFISILNAIRENNIDYDMVEEINLRHTPYATDDPNCVTLTTTNARALAINEAKLAELKEPEFTFYGIAEGEYFNNNQRECPTDPILTLKKGAQVIFVKNDIKKRWVNGDIGTIVKIDNTMIQVEITRVDQTKTYPVEREIWEMIRYVFDPVTGNIKTETIGTFIQYPLKLAWAITIHKGQGATFDKVHIDLGRRTFAHGQTYVALSRCRSLEGLTLERPLRLSDIQVDGRITAFLNKTSG